MSRAKTFRLDDFVRGFYGDKDYTIRDGIEQGKGDVRLKRDFYTRFKNEYYYVEGAIWSRLDGTQARKVIKEKLDKIREAIEAENVSTSELSWLADNWQAVVEFGDVRLAEWAGIPEAQFRALGGKV